MQVNGSIAPDGAPVTTSGSKDSPHLSQYDQSSTRTGFDNMGLQPEFGIGPYTSIQQTHSGVHPASQHHPATRTAAAAAAAVASASQPSSLPANTIKPGSDEYYKIKKDNHKEVERRRREGINRGIDELAKVVPDCDKHKGQILQRAVEYIKKLRDSEQQYLEKMTLEKLLSEQTISELSNSVKSLKSELATAWNEVDHWKRQAEANSR